MKASEQGSLWPEDVSALKDSAQRINMADDVVRICDEWFSMNDLVTLAFFEKDGEVFYYVGGGDPLHRVPEAVAKAFFRAKPKQTA
jgi:hypothetical protein